MRIGIGVLSGVVSELALTLAVAAAGAVARARTEMPASVPDRTAVGPARDARALAGRRPVFIENKGQWDERARFLLRSPGLDLWITDTGVVYDHHRGAHPATVTRTPVFVTYQGAKGNATALGVGKLAEHHNYYLGDDRSRWAERVPLFSDARVQGLYEGIDAVFYLDDGRPRYDLVVAAGADPASIRMKVEGATDVAVAADGALRIATTLGTVEQRELFAYQEVDGRKRKVSCAFAVGADGDVRLDTGAYDRSLPLVIDPVVYATYLGGSGHDRGHGVAIGPDGSSHVTGYTFSADFPTLNAAQASLRVSRDAFVTKVTPSGALAYSTYLGGNSTGQSRTGRRRS